MPWGWGGSGEVIANLVLVLDSNGNIVASIDSQGNITGVNIFATNSFWYQGEELSSILDEFAQGRITSAFLSGSVIGPFSTTGPETMLLQAQFTYDHMRSIWIYLREVLWSFGSTPGAVVVRLRAKLSSGGNVTTADPGVTLYEQEHNITSYGASHGAFRECNFSGPPWNFTTGSTINVAVSMQGFNGTGGNGSVSTSDDLYLVVTDMGTQNNPGSTTNLYTGSPPPAPTFKSFEVAAYDSQSYQQSGNPSNGSGTSPQEFMYFGQDPAYAPNGNWHSFAWFLSTAGGGNGLGSLGDIAGVSSANVQYLDVFVYEDWFYSLAGGTLYIGYTSAAATHGVDPGGNYQMVSATFSGRGQGQWVSILGTGIETGVLNGTMKGLALGPGPTTSLSYYGYADGAARGNPMRIRGGYYK